MSEFYNNYLCSEHWTELRLKVLSRNSGMCEQCNLLKSQHAHHLCYHRLYREEKADLMALCSYCHKVKHRVNTQLDLDKYSKEILNEK